MGISTLLTPYVRGARQVEMREPKAGTVIAHVRWTLDGFRSTKADPNSPGEKREGVFTQVFIYEGSKWAITASHNTMVSLIK